MTCSVYGVLFCPRECEIAVGVALAAVYLDLLASCPVVRLDRMVKTVAHRGLSYELDIPSTYDEPARAPGAAHSPQPHATPTAREPDSCAHTGAHGIWSCRARCGPSLLRSLHGVRRARPF